MIIPKTLEECKSQEEAVLYHLSHFATGLTQDDANELYGIQRLGARIYNLRELGYEIITIRETGKNRFGHTTPFGRYFLKRRNE